MKTKTRKFISISLLGSVLVLSLLAILPKSIAQTPEADPQPAATDHRPKKYSPSRYIQTYTNSPFEREILPPPKAEAGPPPTPFDLKIVGVSRSGERYRVTLVDKKGKYHLVTDKPNKDTGYHYVNIEPAARIQDYVVTIGKEGGTMTEEATFDPKRGTMVGKGAPAPKAPTNSRGRPAVVPNRPGSPPTRGGTSSRTTRGTTPTPPQSQRGRDASRRSGQAATQAIQQARDAAVKRAQANPRANTRRVVLPPPGR